jgi:hypothetical protein
METTAFTALCERAGRWWTIRVPQIEGITAQVRSLDQVEIVTRQLIARTLSISAESIRIDVLPDAPAPVAQALQMRHVARQAVEAATRATAEALDVLAGTDPPPSATRSRRRRSPRARCSRQARYLLGSVPSLSYGVNRCE